MKLYQWDNLMPERTVIVICDDFMEGLQMIKDAGLDYEKAIRPSFSSNRTGNFGKCVFSHEKIDYSKLENVNNEFT